MYKQTLLLLLPYGIIVCPMVNMSEMKVALFCFIVAACEAASTAAFKRRHLQADLGAASGAISICLFKPCTYDQQSSFDMSSVSNEECTTWA